MNEIESTNSVTKKKIRINKEFLVENEGLISFLAFVAGFIFDGLTLTHVDLYEAAIILGSYLVVIALGIVIFNAVGVREVRNNFSRRFVKIIPFVIQFMFGTLLNASFIFYTASAELSISWPFIFFLGLIILVNEIFHQRHQQLTFQFCIFFVSAFLYMSFAVPLVTGKMGDAIFLLSGALSLGALSILALVLSKVSKDRFLEQRKSRIFFVLLIYTIINVSYFRNIIPPIPLALKEINVYHSVVRVDGSYEVTFEEVPRIPIIKGEKIYHALSGESVYVFSSVFAPTTLSLPIYHEWRRYDETRKDWVLESRVKFPISGGRDGGYRGYSMKTNIGEGRWRVDITTGNDLHLGKITFKVERVKWPPILTTATK